MRFLKLYIIFPIFIHYTPKSLQIICTYTNVRDGYMHPLTSTDSNTYKTQHKSYLVYTCLTKHLMMLVRAFFVNSYFCTHNIMKFPKRSVRCMLSTWKNVIIAAGKCILAVPCQMYTLIELVYTYSSLISVYIH